MKLEELFEENHRARLYRGAKINFAYDEIMNNRILGHGAQRIWKDGKRRKEDDPHYHESLWARGFSTTRDIQFARRWGECVYFLDWEKLRHNYKIIPYSWNFHIADKYMNGRQDHKKEREEFVILDVTSEKDSRKLREPNGILNNFSNYLIGFEIDKSLEKIIDMHGESQFAKQYQYLCDHPKFLGFYDNQLKWL